VSDSLDAYLVLSGLLFAIGTFGFLARRNAISMLMSIELMLNAVNLSIVAFGSFVPGLGTGGSVIALLVMVGGGLKDEFDIPGSDTQKATDLIESQFASEQGGVLNVVFAAPSGERLDTAENKQAVEDAVAKLKSQEFKPTEGKAGIESVSDPFDPNRFSDDGRIAYAEAQFDRVIFDKDRKAVVAVQDAVRATVEPAGLTCRCGPHTVRRGLPLRPVGPAVQGVPVEAHLYDREENGEGDVADRASAPGLAHEPPNERIDARRGHLEPGRIRTRGVRDDEIPPPNEGRWRRLLRPGNDGRRKERDGERDESGARGPGNARHGRVH